MLLITMLLCASCSGRDSYDVVVVGGGRKGSGKPTMSANRDLSSSGYHPKDLSLMPNR